MWLFLLLVISFLFSFGLVWFYFDWRCLMTVNDRKEINHFLCRINYSVRLFPAQHQKLTLQVWVLQKMCGLKGAVRPILLNH